MNKVELAFRRAPQPYTFKKYYLKASAEKTVCTRKDALLYPSKQRG